MKQMKHPKTGKVVAYDEALFELGYEVVEDSAPKADKAKRKPSASDEVVGVTDATTVSVTPAE